MPRPLSEALCAFIKSDLQRGCDLETLKSRHVISDNKARKMMRCFAETGEVIYTNKPRKKSGRPNKLRDEHIEGLRKFLAEHPEAFLKDMVLYMELEHSLEVTESTMQRCCKRIGWSLKRQPRPRDELGSWARTLPRDENDEAIRGVRPVQKRPKSNEKKLHHNQKVQLLERTRQFVKGCMSHPRFDASHDYDHVRRVLALSWEILRVEQNAFRKIVFDGTIIELVALMHDIDDHKYRPSATETIAYPSPPSNLDPQTQPMTYEGSHNNPAQNQHLYSNPPHVDHANPNRNPHAYSPPNVNQSHSTQTQQQHPPPNLDPHLQLTTHPPSTVESHLLEIGWPPTIASKVAAITPYISYTAETTNKLGFAHALAHYPELAIVQDADRLDAIGSLGIARAFTYGGAKGREGGMSETMKHVGEKLTKLEGMMKTGEGRRLSVARAERLRIFGRWWQEEMRMVGMAVEEGMEWTQSTSPWVGQGVSNAGSSLVKETPQGPPVSAIRQAASVRFPLGLGGNGEQGPVTPMPNGVNQHSPNGVQEQAA